MASGVPRSLRGKSYKTVRDERKLVRREIRRAGNPKRERRTTEGTGNMAGKLAKQRVPARMGIAGSLVVELVGDRVRKKQKRCDQDKMSTCC